MFHITELSFCVKRAFVKSQEIPELYDMYLEESRIRIKPLLKYDTFASVFGKSNTKQIIKTMIDLRLDPGEDALVLMVSKYDDDRIDLITDFINAYDDRCNVGSTKSGCTALMHACGSPHKKGISNLLLDKFGSRCMPSFIGEDGITAFTLACRNRQFTTCTRLIDMCAQACESTLTDAIVSSFHSGYSDESIEFIIKLIDIFGDSLTPGNIYHNTTALIRACESGNSKVALKIIATYGEKCNPRCKDDAGMDAMSYVMQNKMKDVIKLMLSDEYSDMFMEN